MHSHDVSNSTATTTNQHETTASKQHDADHALNAFTVSGGSPPDRASQSAAATPNTPSAETPAQLHTNSATPKSAPAPAMKDAPAAPAVAPVKPGNGKGSAPDSKVKQNGDGSKQVKTCANPECGKLVKSRNPKVIHCSMACYKSAKSSSSLIPTPKSEGKKKTKKKVVEQSTTFARLPQESPAVRAAKWKKIEATLQKYFYNPEITVAKLILATAASQVLKDFPPCWLMVIAPPGSTKTALLKSLDGLPRFHFVDTMTENTFLSGKIDDKNKSRHEPASLLHRWGSDAVMVCADFSSYLSLDKNRFAAILGQMRRIYDGHLRKETGSDENPREREWKGRLTVIAGCTAEIDRQHKVFQSLGDRFARTRAARFGGAGAAIAAMNQKMVNEQELKQAVHAFMLSVVSWSDLPAPTIPEPLQRRLANLTELLAQARSYVPRDYHDREITGFVETESNTRIAQEIAQVMRGWALLMGRSEVSEEDFALAKRAAWDSIPPVRTAVLKALIGKQQPSKDIPELPRTTVNRAADDLVAIGLADVEEIEVASDCATGDKAETLRFYTLSQHGRTLIDAIKGDGPECANIQALATYDQLESMLGGADVHLGEARKARIDAAAAAKKAVQVVRGDPPNAVQPVRDV